MMAAGRTSAMALRQLTAGDRRIYGCLLPRHCSTAVGQRKEPNPSISVHKSYKVQAALCIERPPTKILEPDFKKRWREFKTTWEKRTGNSISLSDELVFMRFFFHWLGDTTKERQLANGGSLQLITSGRGSGAGKGKGSRKGGGWAEAETSLARVGGGAAVPETGDLDSMLASEGLELAFPEHGRKVVRRRRVEKRVDLQVDDTNIRDIRRLTGNSLFLLVRYPGGTCWTFPKADRVHGESMNETLLKLCERQFGPEFSPHVIGGCPFSHRKRRSEGCPGIQGRKIFYYRARVPSSGVMVSPAQELVSDFAWLSRSELSLYLGDAEWHAVRDGLPLDSLA